MPLTTKIQLAKITDFGKCRIAKLLPTSQARNDTMFLLSQNYYRKCSKFNTMFLTTSLRKMTKYFLELCLYVEEIDFEGGPK